MGIAPFCKGLVRMKKKFPWRNMCNAWHDHQPPEFKCRINSKAEDSILPILRTVIQADSYCLFSQISNTVQASSSWGCGCYLSGEAPTKHAQNLGFDPPQGRKRVFFKKLKFTNIYLVSETTISLKIVSVTWYLELHTHLGHLQGET